MRRPAYPPRSLHRRPPPAAPSSSVVGHQLFTRRARRRRHPRAHRPPPLPAASASALAAILTTDPAELAAIASAAASASPAKTQPASAAGDLAKGLTAIAIKAAPGMKPDGAVATGALKEGGHLGWSVTLAPGKCYAIIGYSPTGQIQDLDCTSCRRRSSRCWPAKTRPTTTRRSWGARRIRCARWFRAMPYKVGHHRAEGGRPRGGTALLESRTDAESRQDFTPSYFNPQLGSLAGFKVRNFSPRRSDGTR